MFYFDFFLFLNMFLGNSYLNYDIKYKIFLLLQSTQALQSFYCSSLKKALDNKQLHGLCTGCVFCKLCNLYICNILYACFVVTIKLSLALFLL